MLRKRETGRVDRLDLRILAALCSSARKTMVRLSAEVGLSPTPCHSRIERLEAKQLILGYRADIDLEKLAGLNLYYVTIALQNWTPAKARRVEAAISKNPYMVSCESLLGSLDYIVRVYARNMQHYREIMAPLQDFELEYRTHPVSATLARPQLHRLIAELAKD